MRKYAEWKAGDTLAIAPTPARAAFYVMAEGDVQGQPEDNQPVLYHGILWRAEPKPSHVVSFWRGQVLTVNGKEPDELNPPAPTLQTVAEVGNKAPLYCGPVDVPMAWSAGNALQLKEWPEAGIREGQNVIASSGMPMSQLTGDSIGYGYNQAGMLRSFQARHVLEVLDWIDKDWSFT